MRVLFFDIETAPTLAYLWNPIRVNYVPPQQTIHEYFVLCWAAKWSDGKKVFSDRVTSGEATEQDDKRVIASLAELLREADIAVGHNVDKFDIPRVNARVMLQGLEPLGPIGTIDTLKLAKSNFGFAHFTLDWIAEQLGVGRKGKTGFELWERCYHGDGKALKALEKYCRGDVTLLEKVFNAMKPHVRRLRRLHDAEHDGQHICPSCGATGAGNFTIRKYYRTAAGTFPQYQCKSCFRYSRGRKSIKENRSAYIPL